MKKHLPLLLLIPFLIVSCESFRTLEVDKENMEIKSDETTATFHITTGGSWSIKADSPSNATPFWTITPDHGRGETEVQVTFEPNITTKHRTLALHIKGIAEEKTLTLLQLAPMPYVEGDCKIMEPDDYGKVPVNGGIVQLSGLRVGYITVRCEQEDITFDKTTVHAVPFYDFRATVPACPNPEGRTLGFFVTVSTESGETTIPYSIKQSGTN